MRIRSANNDDSRRVFEWRNDPVTIGSFRTGAVEWSSHAEWFPAQLARTDVSCIIGEFEGEPCGVVWCHKNKEGIWETSVNLAPQFRGKKLSVPLLSEAMGRIRRERGLVYFSTEIKNDNVPSIKMFEQCGFVLVFRQPDYGIYCTINTARIAREDAQAEREMSAQFVSTNDREIQKTRND